MRFCRWFTKPFTAQIVDQTAPTTPGSVSAVAASATAINLSWAASTDTQTGVGGYRIRRDGVVIATVDEFTLSYGDTGLNASTLYSYTVQAFDRASPVNSSAESSAATATTNSPPADTTPPTVPTGLTATPIDQTRVLLQWNASTDSQSGISAYKLYRGATLIYTGLNLSFEDTGLSSSTSYDYQVLAVDGAASPNESSKCSIVSATTLADQPGYGYRVNAGGPAATDPQSNVFSASENFSGGTALDWQALGVPVVTGTAFPKIYLTELYAAPLVFTKAVPNGDYNVRIHFAENYITWVDGAGDRVMTVVINGVAKTTTLDVFSEAGGAHIALYKDYTITVTTGQIVISISAAGGQNGMCNAIEITSTGSQADIVAPTVPTGLVATALSDTQIGLTWNASTDDGTGMGGYRIRRGGTLIGTSSTPGFVDTGLTANTLYSYTVEAFDKASTPNISAASSSASATTLQSATDTNAMKVLYRWPDYTARMTEFLTAPSGSVGFAIYDADKSQYDRYSNGIDSIITNNIAAIHTAGLYLLGHVTGLETVSGVQQRMSLASFQTRVAAWFSGCPTLDGIYIGAAARDNGSWASAWTAAADWFYSAHPGKLLFFHGGDGLGGLPAATAAEMQSIVNKMDNILLDETWNNTGHDSNPTVPTFPSWITNYARAKFSAIQNNISVSNLAAMESYFLANNIGYAYITDVDVPNAEDATYWSNFKAGLGGGTPPSTLAAPTGISVSGTAGNVSVSWTAASGATGYDVWRDGSYLGTTSSSPYTDTTFGSNESHSYQVRSKNATLSSSLSTPAVNFSTIVATTGTGYPLLPGSSLNVNGGRRDLAKHPFLPDSPWNIPVKDSAILGDAYIHVIPDAGDCASINGQRMFFDMKDRVYIPVTGDIVGAGGVFKQTDTTAALTDVGINHNGPSGDITQGVDRCTPGPTAFQIRWPAPLFIESDPGDNHWQAMIDGDQYKQGSYFARCAAQGGRIAQYMDNPPTNRLSGMGIGEGSHGASHTDAMGGLLVAGEMITEARGGTGYAKHALALGLALYHGRSLDYPTTGLYPNSSSDVREVDWMHQDRLQNKGSGDYSGEYSARGWGGPGNALGPYARLTNVRVGSLIVCPYSLYSTLYPQMQSEFGQMFLQTMTRHGGYNMDTGYFTKLNFYTTGGSSGVNIAPLDDFVSTWQTAYGAPFRCRGDWSETYRTTADKSTLPAWLRVVGAMGLDIDLVMRNCKVVMNNGPGNWGGGTGTPLQPMAPL